jgi:hypothetical protein
MTVLSGWISRRTWITLRSGMWLLAARFWTVFFMERWLQSPGSIVDARRSILSSLLLASVYCCVRLPVCAVRKDLFRTGEMSLFWSIFGAWNSTSPSVNASAPHTSQILTFPLHSSLPNHHYSALTTRTILACVSSKMCVNMQRTYRTCFWTEFHTSKFKTKLSLPWAMRWNQCRPIST